VDEEVSETSETGEGAMRSVATFLDRESARRKSARRTWFGLLALVAGVGALHAMTVLGWLPPEGRDIIASASAVGLGLLAQL
jgi:fatty acid desaturase